MIASRQEALRGVTEALRDGKVIALKGIGGFHLMVAAGDDEAVLRLRELKHRQAKPLALMLPSLSAVRESANFPRWNPGCSTRPRPRSSCFDSGKDEWRVG